MIKDKKTKNSQKQLNLSQLSNNIKGKSDLKIGNVYTFKITAMGANKIGIDEFSYGYSILIPNTQLGDVVKAKIVKIQFKKYKYAVGEVLQKLQSLSELNNPAISDQIPNIGETLDVTITKSGPKSTGIVEFPNNYLLIVPNTIPGQKVKVQITRIKSKFAFAKIFNTKRSLQDNFKLPDVDSASVAPSSERSQSNTSRIKSIANQSSMEVGFLPHPKGLGVSSLASRKGEGDEAALLKEGSKINVLFPLKIGTNLSNDVNGESSYLSSLGLILKLSGISKDGFMCGAHNNTTGSSPAVIPQGNIVLFIKQTLGAKPGDRVKIQLVKILRLNSLRYFAIGKIVEVNPMSSNKKISLIRGNIRQMVKNEMHFGEKVVKVHARMKKYIWLRKKGQNKNKPFIQNGRNIINLLKTRRCLNKALGQLSKYAVKGRTFLFLGTKKPAAELIKKVSLFTKNSFFVNTRWIGGMLTNWKSIKKSIQKISPILKEKQTIINAILEKRQTIRTRLLKKGLVLRKKSKLLIKKARALLFTLSQAANGNGEKTKTSTSSLLIQKTENLNIKRNQRFERSQNLIEKYNKLLEKKTQLNENNLILKQKAFFVKNKYKNIISQLVESQLKLKELTTLFVLGKQIAKIQQVAKEKNIRLVSAPALPNSIAKTQSDEAIKETDSGLELGLDINKIVNSLPNPPQEIFTKISLILSQTNSGIGTAHQKIHQEIKNSSGASKVLILNKLLIGFSSFIPFIRSSINFQRNTINNLEQKLLSLKTTLQKIQIKIQSSILLNKKLKLELNKLKLRFAIERKIIRRLRTKIKQISAQKRLLQYLPKLRYLPTPQIKITETVKYLMKNIVDPKLKYPIELIYDQRVKNQSKKVGAARKKKWQRLEKYFGGISNMTKMKKNQISRIVAIIIGQQEQINAVRECKKLGIKMFNIVDTNCNPTLADHFIPANDDSRNSIKYILTAFLTRIKLAEKIRLRVKKRVTL